MSWVYVTPTHQYVAFDLDSALIWFEVLVAKNRNMYNFSTEENMHKNMYNFSTEENDVWTKA